MRADSSRTLASGLPWAASPGRCWQGWSSRRSPVHLKMTEGVTGPRTVLQCCRHYDTAEGTEKKRTFLRNVIKMEMIWSAELATLGIKYYP